MKKIKKYLTPAAVCGALATAVTVAAVTSYQVNKLVSATGYNAYSAGSYLFYLLMIVVSIVLIVALGYSVYKNLEHLIKNKKLRQAVATLPVAFALSAIMFLLGFAGFEIIHAPSILAGVKDFAAGAYALEWVFRVSYWAQIIMMCVYTLLFAWKDEKVRKYLSVIFCSVAILMLAELWSVITLFQVTFLDFYK